MKTIFYLVLLIPLLSLMSCDDRYNNCLEGEGRRITETIDIQNVRGLDLRTNIKAYVRQGSRTELTIDGYENIREELDIFEVDGVLVIDARTCIKRESHLAVYLTIPNIEVLAMNGSGTIYSDNVIRVPHVDLSVRGSGDIKAAIEANSIFANINGSGDMEIDGYVRNVQIDINGSGDFEGYGLQTSYADVEINRSGDVELFVRNILNARLSGSGDLYFKGWPDIRADVLSSGRIIENN